MAETRQIGNMTREEIHTPRIIDGNPVISLATDWALQGIQHVETEPVATDTYTSQELKAMGLVGVSLIVEAPDQQ
jgi:hypothetical protein